MAASSGARPIAQVICDESEVSEECEMLLRSLPKAKGWLGSSAPLYKYQGSWYYARILHGVISTQQHFHPHPTDILLATIPKSGTTWLKAIAYSIVNRGGKSSAGGTGDNPLLTNSPHDLVPLLEINLYAGKPVPDLSSMPPPRLFASHLPISKLPAAAFCKVVCLCRNPKDTFTSEWNFTNKLKVVGEEETISIEEAFDMFCNGINAFGAYCGIAYWSTGRRAWRGLEDAKGVVDEMVKLCSFDRLSNLQVNKSMNGKINGVPNSIFFRRGNVGDSKNFLSSGMIDRLDRIVKDQFSPFGLEF
uniref:Sulfotransferase n=1 Tax=Kalanchoe fedtschenkoi TaxID=63787 RepID=A0A7N0TUH4_KALFE